MLVERILEQRPGIRLLTAFRAGVGLQLARRHRPDLVLLDRNLPDLSGDEVLERLRSTEQTAAIPVVMLSADAAAESVEALLQAGATDYLTKPVDVLRLLQLVDSIVGVAAV
jgi:DNA-binding response OmpR family regulator